MRPRPFVLGLSGPDGVGKTTVASVVRSQLVDAGYAVAGTYLYGCVACRRSARGRGTTLRVRARPTSSFMRALQACHAFVDALELGLRLRAACRRAAAEGRPTVVVADRTPVDGLAKHNPGRTSLGRVLYERLGKRFDAIVLLDEDPEVLAARDGQHVAADLQQWRDRFASWAGVLGNVATEPLVGRSATHTAQAITQGVVFHRFPV